MKIRSRDSFIIPLMIEEHRAKFFTVSLRVPLEQGLPQGYKGLIVISLRVTGSCSLRADYTQGNEFFLGIVCTQEARVVVAVCQLGK